MEDYFLIGSAVKLTALLSVNTATCTVTVKDSSDIVKVSDATMTKSADKVYTYIFQSSLTDYEGDYTAVVKIVTLDGTCYNEQIIRFKEQP